MKRHEFTESEFDEQERFEQELTDENEFAQGKDQSSSIAPGYDMKSIRQRQKQRIGKSKDGPPKPTWKDDE